MIDARISQQGVSYLVLGVVRGLASDASQVGAKLEEYRPAAVALALSAEECQGIREYFVAAPAEPLVELTGNEVAEIRGLARYGEVRVPNPAWTAAMTWAIDRGVPVDPIDPSDENYATMFTDHISYTELVRRTLRERSLTRHPPTPASADQFALQWAWRISRKGGSARLAQARDEAAVAVARGLGVQAGRLALVVDRERFAGTMQALEHPPGDIARPGPLP